MALALRRNMYLTKLNLCNN